MPTYYFGAIQSGHLRPQLRHEIDRSDWHAILRKINEQLKGDPFLQRVSASMRARLSHHRTNV